jgi:hypothetical protein
MDNSGWIKLHRKSFDNFLYKENRPLSRREAWEDILLRVNYSDSESLIGNEKIICKRGQSTMSLDSWGKLFNWDKSKVKRFFDLLQNNSMIVIENLHKTTRITVCKYEDYQGDRNGDETQMKRKRNGDETQVKPIKESKEDKEKKEEKETIDLIYSLYPSNCPNRKSSTGKCTKDKTKIGQLLNSRSKNEIETIINNYLEDCKKSGTYLKNFGTFLNQLPEVEKIPEIIPELQITFRREGCLDVKVPLSNWPQTKKMYGPQIIWTNELEVLGKEIDV